MSTILDDPVAHEIVALTERQENRRKAIRMALEAAAMSDDEFARWYARHWPELRPPIGSARTAEQLAYAHAMRWAKDFARLRSWILRDLAHEALKR